MVAYIGCFLQPLIPEQNKMSEAPSISQGGLRPREEATCPSLLSQLVAELGLGTQACGSVDRAPPAVQHLSPVPNSCTSASPSFPPSFTTSTPFFCFLVQIIMILLFRGPFLPNGSLHTGQRSIGNRYCPPFVFLHHILPPKCSLFEVVARPPLSHA